MNAVIRDRDALTAMLPLNAAVYLRTHGWQEAHKEAGRYAIWMLNGGERQLEALLPLNREFDDYAIRVSEMLATLATAEQRSQTEILRDISTIFSDVIRIRSKQDQHKDGSVSLGGGVALAKGGRDMLLAAACSAISSRPFHPTRKPDDALHYVEKLRMGQTEQGSFVMTIQSPVTPDLQGEVSPGLPEEAEPFERRVTKTLMRALAAIRNAAEQSAATGSIEPFTRAIHLGVSANLCDAIANLQEETGAESVEVRVSWAPVRAMTDRDIHSRVALPQDVVPLVREASRVFREVMPQEDLGLDGLVTGLQREDGSEGLVTITGLVEGSLRKVKAFLSGSDYDRAIEAHRNRSLVHCEGDLVKEGRHYFLRRPRGFSIEEGQGDSD